MLTFVLKHFTNFKKLSQGKILNRNMFQNIINLNKKYGLVYDFIVWETDQYQSRKPLIFFQKS